MARLIRKIVAAAGLGALALAAGAAAPVVWTETACRGEPEPQAAPRVLTAPEDRRPEARSFLVYPEWHIVYAYEDYAAALGRGDPHDFDYGAAIGSFWSSLCAVRAQADRFGDPGTDAKLTIYTIGLSFTVEMAAKAAYEETAGRLATLLRGERKAPQDAVEREMAEAYGAFLHQTPWYRFDFDGWTGRLWQAPLEGRLRGWERRLALGAEWQAKAAYARLIAAGVGTMAPDLTVMKVHVRGLGEQAAAALPHATVVGAAAEGLVLEVDRYRRFSRTAEAVARAGGDFTEIAGNDDILVSLIGGRRSDLPAEADVLRELPRPGSAEPRFLAAVKVAALASLLRRLEGGAVRLEHVYDY